MIIVADLHLREESSEVLFKEVLPGIFQACIEHNDKEVAILGDVLHVRYKVDARLQNALKDEFQRWAMSGIKIRIIPGNHDQYDIGGRNALELFNELGNVKVYSEPTWDKDGLWIPYRKDPQKVLAAVKLPRATGAAPVLWMHHGIRGSWMNDNVQDVDGIEMSALEPETWRHIFCGHYHKHQKIGDRFWYVGSPWQTCANESNQPKGYMHYLGLDPKFVPQNWGPKYHRFEVAAGDALDLSAANVSARDEIRIVTKGVGAEEAASTYGKQLAEAGFTHHVVTPEVTPLQNRLSVVPGSTLAQYASAYVGQSPTELDKTQLMFVYEEIVSCKS